MKKQRKNISVHLHLKGKRVNENRQNNSLECKSNYNNFFHNKLRKNRQNVINSNLRVHAHDFVILPERIKGPCIVDPS